MENKALLREKELELDILGRIPSCEYDASKKHRGRTEGSLTKDDLPFAIEIVKGEIDCLEIDAKDADEGDDNFRFHEMTTLPEQPYADALMVQLCELLQHDDLDSKKLRFYNSQGSVLDTKFGTNFFLEIHPDILSTSDFGKEVRALWKPFYITANVSKDPSSVIPEPDATFRVENLDSNKKEKNKYGRRDALVIVEKIVEKLKKMLPDVSDYNPPILQKIDGIRTGKSVNAAKINNAVTNVIPTVQQNVNKAIGNGPSHP